MSLPAVKPAPARAPYVAPGDKGPPVAPLNDAQVPERLQDLWKYAKETNLSPAALRWVFLEAKAIGRREVANVEIKRLDSEIFLVANRAHTMETEAARDIVLHYGVGHERIQKANTAYSDACEQVAVCGRMIELLKAKGP